jgi:hypothetical protein
VRNKQRKNGAFGREKNRHARRPGITTKKAQEERERFTG